MGLVTPGLGLIFWTTLSFLILLFLLKKMAWKPILETLKERDTSIDNALKAAERAKNEMQELQSANEDLLKKARNERDELLKEARDVKDRIIAEAKGKAEEESGKLIEVAREAIKNEQLAAQTEIKNMVAKLSIDIAEKVIKQQLSDDERQKALVNNLVDEINLN